MNIAVAKTDSGRAAGDLFAGAADRLPGAGPVAEARREAIESYGQVGLPHRRIEEWKYTDLRALMREVLPLAPAPDTAAFDRARNVLSSSAIEMAARLVLVDGVFSAELSDSVPTGVTIRSLRESLDDATHQARANLLRTGVSDVMLSLNAAMATDGVIIGVADGAKVAAPLQIVHVTTVARASCFTRSLIRIGVGASVTIVESFVGAEGATAHQVNDAVVVSIGDEAEVGLVRLMNDADDAAVVGTEVFTVGSSARLNLFNMTSGGAVSRYQGFITLAGEGGELSVNGVNLLKGSQHGDTTLVVDHAVPNCTSRELFRAVVDDRGHSVFQGRIIVRPDAQKTDGKMMTRALLLSDEAEADSKPELEIFADDVSCGHGATAGALDDSLLFYLRARGLPEKEAQALLIQAFLGEAVEQIPDEQLRDHVTSVVQRWVEMRA